MRRFSSTTRLTIWLLALALLGADGYAATPTALSLAPRRLRGYGEISARFTLGEDSPGGPCSWLTIACETAGKAASSGS
jgi:hypothetical protein